MEHCKNSLACDFYRLLYWAVVGWSAPSSLLYQLWICCLSCSSSPISALDKPCFFSDSFSWSYSNNFLPTTSERQSISWRSSSSFGEREGRSSSRIPPLIQLHSSSNRVSRCPLPIL